MQFRPEERRLAVTLDDLLKELPVGPGPERLPVVSSLDGLAYVSSSLVSFVPPNLADRPDVGRGVGSRIIVVSAAGAVGKSTLAREIACALGLPLWDLALSGPVAQYSLLGLLQQGFGVPAQSKIQQMLASGELGFVIDALDEARVKATEVAYHAFIRDIAELARTASGVGFILLARSQVAETTWLILEESGVPTRLLTIEYFTRDQAKTYIKRRVESMGGRGATVMLDHPKPFAQARDLIFDHLEHAISATGDERSAATDAFLGYAPVLDAIAVLLAGEENLSRTIEELTRGLRVAETTHVGVLEGVVHRILKREQEEKLLHNIKPQLVPLAVQANWSDWELLYSAKEQCARLVARILRTSSGLTLGIPVALRQPYEEAVEITLPEHPFLIDGIRPANAVFESYLLAYVLRNGPDSLVPAVDARLSDVGYKPTRLFADFYLDQVRRSGAPQIPLDHVGWLYDAMLSAESEDLHLALSIDGPEPTDSDDGREELVDAEFEWFGRGSDSEWRRLRTEEFQIIIRPSDTLRIGRYIRRATVTLPSKVALGRPGAEFEIGPNVSILCKHLHVDADRLVVGGHSRTTPEGGDADDGVVLEALSYSGTVETHPTATVALSVSWPGSDAFPWTDFSRERRRTPSGGDKLHEAYRRFRRIVMTLRSHGRGSLARTRRKIEHERVMQGRLGRELLAKMIIDGVFVLKGDFYHWNPDVATKLIDVSWPQLRQGEMSKALSSYLTDFLNSR